MSESHIKHRLRALHNITHGVVERRNHTLVEAARTMLIFLKAPLYLWAEAVSTACYTQNRSLIHLRYNKTPYELMHEKKHDLSFLHVFGSLCKPTNDSKDLGKLKPKADIVQDPHLMTPGTLSLRLVPNPIPQPPYVPPTKNDWNILFQPMFDEFFNPPSSVVPLVPVAAAPKPVDPTGSPVSTLINEDAPSPSNPSIKEKAQSQIIFQGVNESLKTPYFHDDLLHETLS
nr:retrovirus-related Pol polyprotein from transposon TNT 1-94 [Tanacetum cinerariifolium]